MFEPPPSVPAGAGAVVRRLGPYLLLAFLALLFFGKATLHPSYVLYADRSDLLEETLPAKRFLVRSWHETGELPLWCPYSYVGMPFLHDVKVGVFYPPHWPLLLLPEESLGGALTWLVVLHVVIAGWGTFAYVRFRGLGVMGSLVAAVGFMFAGKLLLHLLLAGHYFFAPVAWLPLVLLGLEAAICAAEPGVGHVRRGGLRVDAAGRPSANHLLFRGVRRIMDARGGAGVSGISRRNGEALTAADGRGAWRGGWVTVPGAWW